MKTSAADAVSGSAARRRSSGFPTEDDLMPVLTYRSRLSSVEMPPPSNPDGDRLHRMEQRMDELHVQVEATQKMIRDLAELVQQQQRTTAARSNLRSLSNKVLRNQHLISTDGQVAASGADARDENEALPNNSPDDSKEATDQFAVQASEPKRKASTADAGAARRRSASNPVSLVQEKRQSTSITHALRHATSVIGLSFKKLSIEKAVTPQQESTSAVVPAAIPAAPSHDANGLLMTRRFSMSSLDYSRSRDSRVSRLMRWSRNLFRRRVEPSVSPEEIQLARGNARPSHPLTIRHDSMGYHVWATGVLLLILVDVVLTPLDLGFDFSAVWFPHFNTFVTVVFAADFVVNMFSSYLTERGEVVSGPNRTIPHYLLSIWAVSDFLSWFPFDLFVSRRGGRFLGIAKVIRLAKVSQLARRMQSAKKAGFFRLIRLFGTVFIISHCLACYWNAVAREWRHNEDGYLELTLGHKYAHCWMVVIGCLNASPPAMYTTVEKLSVAMFMLTGNLVQATVFGSVAVLISSFDEEEVAYNRKLITTFERCKFLGISPELAWRIQGYYENLFRETRSVSPDADAFINELSPALICEVKFQLYRDMITQIPFLSASNINPVVIEMLILHLRTVIYMQDDVLIRKGEFGDWMGFIGSKGSVGVLDPSSENRKIIRILRKGDYFGEMALLHRAKRSTTAIALSWVQIHVLCRSDLDDVKEHVNLF
ncbi:hypothetical protein P43SY_000979 [Pythium insidiosum]|uniref:Cyclic nucleotide-binding domain-containing protein n=1 Tax=Pythium insidiosum TaxID=114742 RepID=A0AAD5LFR2_PYTIN|nr:hypothetical protein P43SY_000979 [Pythium insidiosum]